MSNHIILINYGSLFNNITDTFFIAIYILSTIDMKEDEYV